VVQFHGGKRKGLQKKMFGVWRLANPTPLRAPSSFRNQFNHRLGTIAGQTPAVALSPFVMKLADWMYLNGWTPAMMRRELGLKSRSTVYRYMWNEQIPSPPVRRKIYKLTEGQVTLKDFLDPRDPDCVIVVTLPSGETKRLLPWCRGYDEAAAAKAKVDEIDEEPCWQLRMAERLLGHRQKRLQGGFYLLDGRVADARRLVASANRIRMQWGQAPISYPGVRGGQVRDER
jgi:hypothetical protein